jgi:acetylornithine deacetylase
LAATAVRGLIDTLVGFDTTSREPNRDLIHFVGDYLKSHGVASEAFWNAEKSKANLWATIGPDDKPGIILSGHTDVVPVDGQAWSSDPFTPREADGRLYGRGTADMKSFIATALAAVPAMTKLQLAAPIHLAFSFDEEVGCIGVRSLIAELGKRTPRPALCIVGEPTEMRVIIGHKGSRGYRVRVRGSEAHSSLAPRAVNAIEYAAELMIFLKEVARELAEEGPRDEAFDVPHSTLQTSMIAGGTAINIVPKDCEFAFEYRHLLEVDPESIIARVKHHADHALAPRMQKIAPEAGFTFEELFAYPAMGIAPEHPAVTFVKALVGRNEHAKVAFGTEGGLYQRDLAIPTIICGPGSINEAHKPDEFVALEQVAKCERFLGAILARAADGALPAA